MVYDEDLAERFRSALKGLPSITEKRMMGGVCFFQHGNMIGGCDRAKTGERRFMFRVGQENEAAALMQEGTSLVEFGGNRRMGGMVFVDAAAAGKMALQPFLKMALDFVSTLPPIGKV